MLTRRNRRGNAITILMSLPVLLGTASFSIDLGQVRVEQAQLQYVTDQVAQAGVAYLDGTSEGLAAADAGVRYVAGYNAVMGRSVTLDSITTGQWTTFFPEDGSDETSDLVLVGDPIDVDAIQVVSSTVIPTYFAGLLLGADGIPIRASAIAVRQAQAAGSVDCYMPLAVPDCALTEHTSEDVADFEFKLSPSGIDNAGWSQLSSLGSPNAHDLRSQLSDCRASGDSWTGDNVWLGNGTDTSVLKEIVSQLKAGEDVGSDYGTHPWDDEVYGEMPSQHPNSALGGSYGNVFEGPVLVFEGTADYCAGHGKWNEHDMPLTGFAWGALYDVNDHGHDKFIRMRIDTVREHDFGTSTGGDDYGVVTYAPVLVH